MTSETGDLEMLLLLKPHFQCEKDEGDEDNLPEVQQPPNECTRIL